MTFETAMAGRLPPRRRIGLSDKAALLCGVLACICGAAAWINESLFSSSVGSPVAQQLLSFEERFAQMATPSLRGSLQPPDRSALAAIESRMRDAKGVLAQKLQLGEWRTALLYAPSQPGASEVAQQSAADVPLPRSRPAGAGIAVTTVANVGTVAAIDTVPRLDAPAKPDRTLLQKLSDLFPARLTLASLAPGDGLFRSHPDLQALGYDSQTAVYDISAHKVYLPSGLTLEAHSGLGMLKDNPETVQARNAGATPPAVYDLRPREKLFHGVPALRMIPADGSDTLGRAGLLVHSFMLGPEGDSNGCVSIRDFVRFRKAYDDGEINRLVVVPAMTAAPANAARSTAQS